MIYSNLELRNDKYRVGRGRFLRGVVYVEGWVEDNWVVFMFIEVFLVFFGWSIEYGKVWFFYLFSYGNNENFGIGKLSRVL